MTDNWWSLNAGDPENFPLIFAQSGTYSIALTTTANDSTGEANILIDGVPLGTVTIPSSGNTVLVDAKVVTGYHVLRIEAIQNSTSWNLSAVVITGS